MQGLCSGVSIYYKGKDRNIGLYTRLVDISLLGYCALQLASSTYLNRTLFHFSEPESMYASKVQGGAP